VAASNRPGEKHQPFSGTRAGGPPATNARRNGAATKPPNSQREVITA
jgi:hypothetical protein